MQPKNKIYFDEEQHLYFSDEAKTIVIPNFSAIVSSVLGDSFCRVPEHIRSASLTRGKLVHKITENYDRNIKIDPNDEFYGYSEHLEQWIKFKKDAGIKEFDAIEEPLFVPQLWYATTPDRFYGDTLINIKTGNEYKNHKLQTAAESLAIGYNYNVKINHRLTVTLTESTYKVNEHKKDSDYDYWIAVNKTFQWKEFEK